MRVFAVDLGGTHANCGVVENRTILTHKIIDIDRARSLQKVLPVIEETLRELAQGLSLPLAEFSGLAVGFAGLVDFRAGRVMSTNAKYEDAPGLDLQAWCQQSLGLPLRIENDARLALLGEAYAGAARSFGDVVMMTLGTGIGGVAMIEGRLLRGKHAQAGCLGGHLPVLFNGRKCTCGAIGCAESEAGGWALPFVVKEWPEVSKSSLSKYSDIGFKELFAEAMGGDEVATAIRDRCLKIWAVDAVGLVHAYDPEIIVIGGGVMKSAALIVPYVESYVQKFAWTPWGKVNVRAAELGNNAALLGAVPLFGEN